MEGAAAAGDSRSSDSGSTIDDYEVVKKVAPSPPDRDDSFFIANENADGDGDDDDDVDVFRGVGYLGAEEISDPKNEQMIHRQIGELNAAAAAGTTGRVVVAVPTNAEGSVSVVSAAAGGEKLFDCPVNRIIFFARGVEGSPESGCFAITLAVPGGGGESGVVAYRTEAFRCEDSHEVTEVFKAFARAFKKPQEDVLSFHFRVSLEIKEPDAHGEHEFVPRQRGVFKLRKDLEKKVIVSVGQVFDDGGESSPRLAVERCFAMLVSPGRNGRHEDMQLLERVAMAASSEAVSVITGDWDPKESALAVLNTETLQDVPSVYATVAADLMLSGVAEPVRFVVETRARIYPKTERHWYFTRKASVRHFRINLKRKKGGGGSSGGVQQYQLVNVDIGEEVDETRGKKSLSMQLVSLMRSSPPSEEPSLPSPTLTATAEEDDDADDPMLSGFGEVSKECSGDELEVWSRLLREWDKLGPRATSPRSLRPLVRTVGVPEALRGEVWSRITGASEKQEEIVEAYRVLITKESPDDKVILRDIHRTFPAHDFFKEAGGAGQESLYRIAKAYSVYDAEVGYCQGQSFLIAALLLQMPEEQAFGVLVQVMHGLGLRDMFRENFEHLQMRLYQLDRLIESQLPEVWSHFQECGVESHMFASQWFLTVFTAKFPLFLVFRVLDVFLLDGFEFVFQVALALLKVSRRDLLAQDFEGLMKYFRVNIPKCYRSEENARRLIAVAARTKLKKVKKFEKEWLSFKAAEAAQEDPLVRLERENKRLAGENHRLDAENDALARELVNGKIEMRREMDAVEEERDGVEKELEALKAALEEQAEERGRLEVETEQLKALLKREVEKYDAEVAGANKMVAEYKSICSQLSVRIHHDRGSSPSGDATQPSSAGDRVKELELELAKTKLALVETECKNQDLSHQLLVVVGGQEQAKGTWFAKTLSSIKETAAASGAMTRSVSMMAAAGKQQHPAIAKSASVEDDGVRKSSLQ